VAQEGQALEAEARAERDVPARVRAQGTHDPVGVLAPGHELEPIVVAAHVEASGARAHRIVGRRHPHLGAGQRAVDGAEDAAREPERIDLRALIDDEQLELMEGLEARRALDFAPVDLPGGGEPLRRTVPTHSQQKRQRQVVAEHALYRPLTQNVSRRIGHVATRGLTGIGASRCVTSHEKRAEEDLGLGPKAVV